MADGTLADYFKIAPSSTTWGVGQSALAQSLPLLMQTGGTRNQQFGTALGVSLLSALLGFQARRSAAEQSLQAAEIGTQLLKATTPEERLGIIKGVETGPVQQQLLGLNARLSEQEILNNLAAKQTQAQAEAKLAAELSGLGKKVYERDLAKEITLQELRNQPQMQRLANIQAAGGVGKTKDFWEKIPAAQKSSFTAATGQVSELRRLADRFDKLELWAPELLVQKQKPGSEADLAISAMNIAVPSTARLLGEVGNLAQEEQQRLITATLGGPLSGSQSIAARLRQLADFAENKITASLEAHKTAATLGGGALLEQLKGGPLETAARDFLNKLKSKYGAEWATKATAEERQTAMALKQAAGKGINTGGR